MKKNYILTTLFTILLASATYAQNFTWVKTFGNRNYGIDARNIVADGQGNTYTTGTYYDVTGIGKDTFRNEGGIIVFKLDKNGNIIWASEIGKDIIGSPTSMALDNNGNIIVAGSFGGTADFGTNKFTSNGQADLFIAKLDTTGKQVWTKQISGKYTEKLGSLATDEDGNTIIAGTFYNKIDFDNFSLSSASQISDMFLAKYSAAGNLTWAIASANDIAQPEPFGLGTDSSGNIYLASQLLYGEISFAGTSIKAKNVAEAYDILVIKLNSAGVRQWLTQGSGYSTVKGGFAVSPAGESYLQAVTDYPDTATLGNLSLKNPLGILLFKLSVSGAPIWVNQSGGGQIIIKDIAIDALGNTIYSGIVGGSFAPGEPDVLHFGEIDYLVDYSQEKMLAVKVDSTGKTNWVKDAGTVVSYSIVGWSLTSDAAGDIYILGQTGNTTGSPRYNADTAYFDSHYIYIPKSNSQEIKDKTPAGIITFVTKIKACDLASPIITQNGKSLYTTKASSYQWFFNGTAIAGAKDSIIIPTKSGKYSVSIIKNGCEATSLESDITVTGIQESPAFSYALYPNPTTGIVSISFANNVVGSYTVTDISGRQLGSYKWYTAEKMQQIDMRNFSNGVYFINFQSKDFSISQKIILRK